MIQMSVVENNAGNYALHRTPHCKCLLNFKRKINDDNDV